MICEDMEQRLLEFHFGLARDRESIEAHLVECRACLQAFLDVKRAVEAGDEDARPSKALRVRLRNSVRNELRPLKWIWWERPAAFAVAASIVLLAGAAVKQMTSGPGSPPNGMQSR